MLDCSSRARFKGQSSYCLQPWNPKHACYEIMMEWSRRLESAEDCPLSLRVKGIFVFQHFRKQYSFHVRFSLVLKSVIGGIGLFQFISGFLVIFCQTFLWSIRSQIFYYPPTLSFLRIFNNKPYTSPLVAEEMFTPQNIWFFRYKIMIMYGPL